MPIILPTPMPAVAVFRRNETSKCPGTGEVVAVSTAGDVALYVCLCANYIGADTTKPTYEIVVEQSDQASLTQIAIRNLRRLVYSIEAGYIPPAPSGNELDDLNKIIAARGVPDDREGWIRRLSQDTGDLVD
jgi:hypothetical protein